MKWMGHVACMEEEKKNAYRVLIGVPEGKRSHGRPRLRWEDNLKMSVKEIQWEVWTRLTFK
jgi:hypothetical protein